MELTICTKISVKNFCEMVLAFFFWHRKQERDWVVPFTKYRYIFRFLSTLSLTLVIQTNGTENFGRFGKNGRTVTPRKVVLYFRKISTGMKRSIWIFPGISGYSIQTVSTLRFTFTPNGNREFVPRDQVFSLIVVHCLLLLLKNK